MPQTLPETLVLTENGSLRAALRLAAGSLLIFGAFFSAGNGPSRQLILYGLVPLGLFFAPSHPAVLMTLNAAGLLLLFFFGAPHWWPTTLGLSLLLIATSPIPFSFRARLSDERQRFERRRRSLASGQEELRAKETNIASEVRALENEIERINKLYVLSRELVEHVNLGEVLDHLERLLLDRPGVKSVSVFAWRKDSWELLSSTQYKDKDKWLEFIVRHKSLRRDRSFHILPSPAWLCGQEVVLWPVTTGRELLAVLLLTTEPGFGARCLEEGKIFVPQIALGLLRTKLFIEVEERLRHDGLTGLYNRRYFLERLSAEIQRSKRYGTAFSLLMADIDRFKQINDSYGHLVGDKVLAEVSRIIRDALRPGDLAGRFGGEEFIVLLPLTSYDEAVPVAARIGEALRRKTFTTPEARFKVTVSVGISHYPTDGTTADQIFACADKALYWVKAHGRNNAKEYRTIPVELPPAS